MQVVKVEFGVFTSSRAGQEDVLFAAFKAFDVQEKRPGRVVAVAEMKCGNGLPKKGALCPSMP